MELFSFQNYNIDKVVVLHLIEDVKRKEFIDWEFEQLGFDTSKLEWHIAVCHPWGPELTNGFNKEIAGKGKGRGFTKANEISCLREHYTIIKKAYFENAQSVLIIEDDARFNKDINFIKKFMENIPADYDICQGDCFCANPELKEILDEARKDENGSYWIKHDKIGCWNCSFILYSRRGMAYFLNFIDNVYMPADMPVFMGAGMYYNKVNVYLSKYPILFQEDNTEIPSNIRTTDKQEQYQNIYNVYIKDINKDDYFSYNEYKNSINTNNAN